MDWYVKIIYITVANLKKKQKKKYSLLNFISVWFKDKYIEI